MTLELTLLATVGSVMSAAETTGKMERSVPESQAKQGTSEGARPRR